MPRATKKVSPVAADPAPAPESLKPRKGKRPAEDEPGEEKVPSKAPRKVASKGEKVVAGLEKVSKEEVPVTTTVAKAKKVVAPKSSDDGLSGTLHCFGTNDCGQLGFECEKRKFPAIVPTLLGKKITKIVCGGMHTLALESNGTLWSFGINDDKALGRRTEEEEETFEPGVVTIPGKVIQMSAGDSHSAVLTEDGSVYAWGCFKDDNGNFGLVADDGEICKETPMKITTHLDVKIKKIVSGGHHIAMLAEDGRVFTCGNGSQGQLGRTMVQPKRVTRSRATNGAGDGAPGTLKEHYLTPSVVKIGRNAKVNDIWAGEFATFCSSGKSNEIYVFGLNNHAQLGIESKEDNSKNVINLPTKTTSFKGKHWKVIAGGQHHVVALDLKGKVYTLGRNTDGRLGLGEDSTPMFDEPQIVQELADKTCVHVAAGATTSYALTNEGHLYSWGFGENFQLATGDDKDRKTPTRCFGKPNTHIEGKVLSVAAGGLHVGLTISLPPPAMNGTS